MKKFPFDIEPMSRYTFKNMPVRWFEFGELDGMANVSDGHNEMATEAVWVL